MPTEKREQSPASQPPAKRAKHGAALNGVPGSDPADDAFSAALAIAVKTKPAGLQAYGPAAGMEIPRTMDVASAHQVEQAYMDQLSARLLICMLPIAFSMQRQVHKALATQPPGLPADQQGARLLIGVLVMSWAMRMKYKPLPPAASPVPPQAMYQAVNRPKELMQFARWAAETLQELKDSGFLCNNVRPASIYWDRSLGRGLIRMGDSVTKVGQDPGPGHVPNRCFWYWAPEFTGANYRDLTNESDLWGMGIIMLWMRGTISLPELGLQRGREWDARQLPGFDPNDLLARARRWQADIMDIVKKELAPYGLDGVIAGMLRDVDRRWTMPALTAAVESLPRTDCWRA